MFIKISGCKNYNTFSNQIVLIDSKTKINKLPIEADDAKAAEKWFHDKNGNTYSRTAAGKSLHIVKADETKALFLVMEACRKAGNQLNRFLNENKATEASFYNATDKNLGHAFIEGLLLSNYQFLKYKTRDKKVKSLAKLHVQDGSAEKAQLEEIAVLVQANFVARDLVNEPVSTLTATHLSKEIAKTGKQFGFKVEVLDKRKIQALKMGGLLAVNKGSQDPPTFTIMEWKPKNARNKQPIVLVGKGIVYDTGGLSLKPTPNSMDMMKCDMAGAATVTGTLAAVASLKLPIHVVGLVPATDNRPGENAYTPGDVVTMMSGLNVEVLNTDAEGRMILADALHYAKKYKPELVFDFATLTGAAKAATGSVGTVYMGNAGDEVKKRMIESSEATYERLVEFPIWDEYGEMILSDVADIKNIGGAEAGSITAGKFLQHFTDYPWLHFDIAGTAYVMHDAGYRGKYATGVGVRLVTHFLKNYK